MNGLSSAFPSFRSAIQTSPSDHRRHLAASPGPGRTLSSSPPLLTTGNCVLPRTFSHWTAGRQQTEGGRWQAGVRRAGRGMVHSDDITEEQRTSLGDTEAHWGKRWLLLGSGCFLEFSKGPMGLAGSQHFIVHEQATRGKFYLCSLEVCQGRGKTSYRAEAEHSGSLCIPPPPAGSSLPQPLRSCMLKAWLPGGTQKAHEKAPAPPAPPAPC